MAFYLSPCRRELERTRKGSFAGALSVAGVAEAAEQCLAPFEALHLTAETAKEVICLNCRPGTSAWQVTACAYF